MKDKGEGEHNRRDVYERSGQTIAPMGRCKSTAHVKSFELSLIHWGLEKSS